MQQPRLSTVIWRGKWIIVVAILAGLAAAALATTLSSKVYEATALLDAGGAATASSAQDSFDQQQAGEALARSYATTLDSPSFLARIAPSIDDGRLSGEELQSRVDATQVKDTTLVSLAARGASPEEARDLTAAIAARFAASLRGETRAQLAALRADLRERIAAIDAEIAETSASSPVLAALGEARAALTQQLAGVIAGAGIGRVALNSPPDAPTSPIQPRPILYGLAGLLVGALVGLGLAWLWVTAPGRAPLRSVIRPSRTRGSKGPRLQGGVEAKGLHPAPELGTVPADGGADSAQGQKAFDAVYALLRERAQGRSAILGVLSGHDFDGRETISQGIAQAAARDGRNVLVVDGDVLGRRLSQSLGYGRARGLGEMILGSKPRPRLVTLPDGSGFSFMPAGKRPPDRSPMWGYDQLRMAVDELAETHSLVLIEAPVAAISDHGTHAVAAASDALVLVARAADADAMAPLAPLLGTRSHGPILGVVTVTPVPGSNGSGQVGVGEERRSTPARP